MKSPGRLTGSILILAIAAGCGAGDRQAGPTPDQPAASPSPAAGGSHAVDIFDFGYNPATFQTSAGTTITWTNTGDAPHTVTFEEGPDSGQIEPGGTFEHAFDTPGIHDYMCTIHPSMRGVVNVSP